MKHYVILVTLNRDEKGFTFYSKLLTLFIITITLPFLIFILQYVGHPKQYDDMSIQQFFIFMREEIRTSNDIYTEDNKLYIKQNGDQYAVIEQRGQIIRRQLRGGHEVYLRQVKALTIESLTYGIKMSIVTEGEKSYEKIFIFYK